MSGNRIDPNKLKFFELGFDSLVKNNDMHKFMRQLHAKSLSARKKGDTKGLAFFKDQKKIMSGKL